MAENQIKPHQNSSAVSRTCTGGTTGATRPPRSHRGSFQNILPTFICTNLKGALRARGALFSLFSQGHACRSHRDFLVRSQPPQPLIIPCISSCSKLQWASEKTQIIVLSVPMFSYFWGCAVPLRGGGLKRLAQQYPNLTSIRALRGICSFGVGLALR